jgi:hypothetical protein
MISPGATNASALPTHLSYQEDWPCGLPAIPHTRASAPFWGDVMGASNVLAAYSLYAGKVPPQSMVLLAYMAAVSKDSDANPWFGMGHQALAQFALGRPAPAGRADIKAVERSIAPLVAVGAIATARRAAPRGEGPKTVRYLLNLRVAPRISGDDCPDIPLKPGDESANVPRISGDDAKGAINASDISGGVDDHPRAGQEGGSHPPETVPVVPHIPASHPPESGHTSPEIRGTEDYEEDGGAIGGGESGSSHLRAGIARARTAGGKFIPLPRQSAQAAVAATITKPRPSGPTCACSALLDPDGTCFICRRSA